MSEFATVVDLKAHLNWDGSTGDDDELGFILDAASDVVRFLVGSFASAAVTERVTAAEGTVLLSRRSVSGVTLNGGAVTGFTVNEAAGLLYDVPWTCGPLTASYTATGGQVPRAVTLATLIIAGHLWQTQRGPQPTPVLAGPDDGLSMSPGMGYAIPNRAVELLQPYVQVHLA